MHNRARAVVAIRSYVRDDCCRTKPSHTFASFLSVLPCVRSFPILYTKSHSSSDGQSGEKKSIKLFFTGHPAPLHIPSRPSPFPSKSPLPASLPRTVFALFRFHGMSCLTATASRSPAHPARPGPARPRPALIGCIAMLRWPVHRDDSDGAPTGTDGTGLWTDSDGRGSVEPALPLGPGRAGSTAGRQSHGRRPAKQRGFGGLRPPIGAIRRADGL
jgi:hypothetical protein